MDVTLGLNGAQVNQRQKRYGLNEIIKTKKNNPLILFLHQFFSPLMVILVFAAIVSLAIGKVAGQETDYIDAALILLIVILSGVFGFLQEYKAEKSIEALQKISAPSIQTYRDGKILRISAIDLVPGDIVLLEAGDIVPADGEIIEGYNLKIDEAVLTGESKLVSKKNKDKAFMGTSVFVGNGKMLIEKTGMQTQIGKIAEKLQEIKEEKTSFEIETKELSKIIFWLIILIATIIFIANFIRFGLYTSLLTSISLAVAAIPESLPAVIVLSLALGAQQMYKNNALIRKLNIIESVGAVDVICSDKTGTITKNEMEIQKIFLGNKIYNIKNLNQLSLPPDFKILTLCGMLCNNVKADESQNGKEKYLGDPTEISFIKSGEELGIYKKEIDARYLRINEEPFSSERKMMSVVVRDKDSNASKFMILIKGAPEIVIKKCARILMNGEIRKLTKEEEELILNQNNNFAEDALRVLGLAYKEVDNTNDNKEENLIWIGLEAMIDAPRPMMDSFMAECKTAGIRVIMITGDNSATAQAIAKLINLNSQGVIGGEELDKMNDAELKQKLKDNYNIFARTTAFHKLRILKILQKNNRVVMTGDGVNDALALKQANIGVAMGKRGAEVTKEASDIILIDDNFKTIVLAVKEGRRIFNNIRKFINYLLVSNFTEVAILFIFSIFISLKEPILLPVQLLWINLLTDGLPALALGADPARQDIMQEPPRKKNEPIINKRLGLIIIAIGIQITLFLLITYFIVLPKGEEIARSVIFTGIICYEFVRIATIRSQEKLSWLSNPWLLLAVLASLLMQIIIIYSPLNSLFHVQAFGLYEWLVIGVGVIISYVAAKFITKQIIKYTN